MIVRSISENERDLYDQKARHPLQSFAWGEFRVKTGTVVERIGIFEKSSLQQVLQITFHPVPYTSFTIGYFPKGGQPDEQMLTVLRDIGKRHNALFIKLEPDLASPVGTHDAHKEISEFLESKGCVRGKPLFTPYTFQLSLTPTEDQLLAAMHQKTRYNINLAARKGVTIVEDTSPEGLGEYLSLMHETTKRQGFYAHGDRYYQQMFETIAPSGMLHIFKAVYEKKTLSVWIIFTFGNKLYYPYGASSREHRDVMANNLLAWEVIKFGKAHGCTVFDMWGSLGPNPNPKDPWYGFHTFKQGFGGTLVHFVGTFDLVLNPTWYNVFQKLDALRWKFLRLRTSLGI